MKKLLMILLAALTLTGATAQAQGNRSWRVNQVPMTANGNAAYWAKELGLTASQRQQIERLNREYTDFFHGPQAYVAPPKAKGKAPKSKSWHAPAKGKAPTPPRKPADNKSRKDLDKQWKEYKKNMKKILTSKQYKTYEKLVKQPY